MTAALTKVLVTLVAVVFTIQACLSLVPDPEHLVPGARTEVSP